jgi:mycothiol system anti-sigma-R factor
MAEDCNETLRELYLYLDGQLTEDDRVHIQQHLDDCSPCLEAYDFEAELRLVVRSRCVDEVPESLRARIARALEREG